MFLFIFSQNQAEAKTALLVAIAIFIVLCVDRVLFKRFIFSRKKSENRQKQKLYYSDQDLARKLTDIWIKAHKNDEEFKKSNTDKTYRANFLGSPEKDAGTIEFYPSPMLSEREVGCLTEWMNEHNIGP